MHLLLKLASSNLRVHRVRAMLTIAAIALSVSLVVSVTSGYASIYAAAHKMLTTYIGTTDAQITRQNESRGGIDESLLAEIRNDPDVVTADGRLELENGLMTARSFPVLGRAAQLVGVDRPGDEAVEAIRMDSGRWFDTADGDEAVVDQVAFEHLHCGLGGTFIVPGVDRKITLRIVGVVHKPTILATMMQTIYVPLHTLQNFAFPDKPHQISRILIDLKPGVDENAFLARWQPRLEARDGLLKMRLSSQNKQEMDRNLQGLHMLSYLGGAVSMAAATFIVFSALSMGVTERQRSLAMLRAVGTLRSQLGWLVVLEGILLALIGVVVGVPLGFLWLKLLVLRFDVLFFAGAVWSIDGIIIAIVGSIVAALLASLLPALAAMRASPLDAMTPLATPSNRRSIFFSTIGGLCCAAVDPLVLFLPINRTVQFWVHFTLGLPLVMLGFFLLAPVFVILIERLFAPIVAPMLGLRYEILRQQLSGGGVWRAAGTCAALMVGLSILVVTQTQGTTAIRGWKLPDKFPDVFIWSSPGLTAEELSKLSHVEGIRSDQTLPVAMASPQLGSGVFAIAGAAMMPDATMFFGVDPDQAMKMMELDFREGNAADATAMLKRGKHIIVTQEYKQVRGLGVGSTIPLKTSKGMVDFTVAGVVWSPGIDVIASMHDLGKQFDQRTAASMFGSMDDAKEYFGVDRIHVVAANLRPHVEKERLIALLQKQLGGWGLDVGDVRQIKFAIQKMLGKLLLVVSTVAYAAMAVASLGVANTIMASVRSRRWQFGILRSIGATRGQLGRLVLAEAVLLGFVGVGLGLAAGAEMAVNARQEWNVILGYAPPIVIPWLTLAIGGCAIMLISILASVGPALSVSRTEPLSLLQAGRAAA